MAKGLTVKKKKWVQIIAPKVFNEQVLGESYVSSVDNLVGRSLSVSLMQLTGEPQKQSVHVHFRITGAKEGKASAEVTAFKMLPSAAKKLVRRKRTKLADSFIVETKDKKLVRIKPLATTRGRVTSSLESALRKIMRSYIALAVSKLDAEGFVRLVVQKKFQSGMAKQMKKIHPMGPCVVRQFEFVAPEKAKNALRVLPPKVKKSPAKEGAKSAEQAA